MHHQPFISTPSISISIFTLLLFIIFLLPVSYTQDESSFRQCLNGFDCGNVKSLMFPFWKEDSPEYCRQEGFQVIECEEDHQPVIRIGETKFRLVSVDQPGYRMTIAREDLWDQVCSSDPSRITNVTLGYSFLRYSDKNRNLTFFYNCESSFPAPPASAHFLCAQGSDVPVYAADLVDRGSYEQFFGSCHGGPIQVQVNESAFQQLQTGGLGNVDSEGWQLGFDVFYPFADLFCEKCKMQNGSCENMASPRYAICKHPAIVPCLRGLRPTSHCLISYFSNVSPLVLIGDCLISYFSTLSLLVLIGAFQIYALKFEGYKPRSLAAHRSIIACLWASVPLAQLCRLAARISDWRSMVVLF